MSLKKYFKKDDQNVTRFSKRPVDISSSLFVESFDFLKQKSDFRKKIFGFVDISASLSSYINYGLAEQYYENGISRIYNDYPYDGTAAEKLKFHNNSNTFDYFIWKELYPKTTGYVTLNEGTERTQRIEAKAGPNLDNVYKESSRQTNNLAFDSERGVTVEFWANIATASTAESRGLLQLSDSGTGSFLVYHYVSGSDITWQVGSLRTDLEASFSFDTLATKAGSWHHYALVFESLGSGSYLTGTLYVDGAYTQKKIESTYTMSEALATVSGNIGRFLSLGSEYYYSGSIDEFRYWKSARNAKEIGLNWNSSVHGGSNDTSGDAPFHPLSLYFKFNEGITTTATTDSVILDYSGRLASASFLSYESTSRSTGSAIEEYTTSDGISFIEEKDPIIYSNNSRVAALVTDTVRIGEVYDNGNPFSFYALMPEWVRSEDKGELKKLSHIIGAYFDELFSQIKTYNKVKDGDYNSYYKIFPYYDKLLESHGFNAEQLFEENTVSENLFDRNDIRLLSSGSIETVKQKLYRNVYNNLLYIYKTKGTDSSIRNLLHCYGVDENLIRLRTYSYNTVATIENNEKVEQFKDKTIDFYGLKNLVDSKALPNQAIIFNFTSSTDTNYRSYIPSLGESFTLESNVYFTKHIDFANEFYVPHVMSSSIFGVHSADSSTPTDTTFTSDNYTGMAVYAVRNGATSKQARFTLSSSNGYFQAISSDLFELYDARNWMLALVFEPQKDLSNLQDATTSDYYAKLYGYEIDSGFKVNSFAISSSIAAATATLILAEDKRSFVGSERTNFTGSVLYNTDCRIGNFKYYADSLAAEEVELHARFKNTQGRNRPFENFNRSNRDDTNYVPKFLSTLFEWDFEQVTSPTTGSTFEVSDVISGAMDLSSDYGDYGAALGKNYAGMGYGFASGIKVYENEFVSKAKVMLPEESFGANKVVATTDSDIAFEANMAPGKESIFIAKSMYDVISQDILYIFAGLVDFNELIGNPVNKYRENYKSLERLRDLYFDRVANDPDLDKFVTYFKWLDSVIYTIIDNLIPASADFAGQQTNVVESHVLERSKYAYKFPTLEFKASDPTGSIGPIVNIANKLPTTGSTDDRIGSVAAWDFASASAGNYIKNYQVLGGQSFKSGTIKPITITNKLPTTGTDDRIGSVAPYNFLSATAGNYDFNYQVFNTVGRKANNLYIASQLPRTETSSPYVSGTFDYLWPARNKTKSIIVQRFNAPGGVETAQGFLDPSAREYSVYNALPWRNYGVRRFLNEWDTTHQAWGGYKSGSSVTASYHKVNRNPRTVPSIVGTTSYSNYSILFDGTNDRVSIPYNEVFNTDKVTISAWINKTGVGEGGWPRIIEIGDNAGGGTGYRFFVQHSTGYLGLDVDWTVTDGNFITTSGIASSSWHHVAVTYDATNASNVPIFYINGIAVSSTTTLTPVGAVYTISGETNIGNRSDAQRSWAGYIDEVSIWNKKLSANEVWEIYEPADPAIKGPFDLRQHPAAKANSVSPNGYLVGWWRMGDDKEGSAENYTIPNQLGYADGTMTSFGAAGVSAYPPSNSAGTLNAYTTYGTRKIYDNWFIQHAIPQSDLQYAWINASYISAPNFGAVINMTGSNITFVSASDIVGYLEIDGYTQARYFGVDKNSAPADAMVEFLPVDFVGLNNVVVDPVTSSQNHLGFPLGLFGNPFCIGCGATDRIYYINPSLAAPNGVDNGVFNPSFPGTPSVLNAILLNRNGPYGYPSWKQIRGGEHPVARAHRQTNTYSYVVGTQVGAAPGGGPLFLKGFENVIEPPITRAIPFYAKVDGSSLLLKASYENMKRGFANPTDILKNNIFEQAIKKNTTLFDKVFEQPDANFSKIGMRTQIFPKDEIAYLDNTRTRDVFDNTWWRDMRVDRQQTNVANSMELVIDGTTSRYSMDADIHALTVIPPLSASDPAVGSGELQNHYCGFNNSYPPPTSNIQYGPLYARRTISLTTSSHAFNTKGLIWTQFSHSVTNTGTLNVGEAVWEVGSQSGKNPFYNSYDNYSEELRLQGKDHSIVPEFIISDHINTYLSNGFNFKANLTASDGTSNLFSLTGSSNSNIAKNLSSVELGEILDVVKGKSNLGISSFALRASALLKLLPYEGFYPQQRTVQLAQELSSSLKDSFALEEANATFGTVLKPFVSPGILFNTIKSGLAVDAFLPLTALFNIGTYSRVEGIGHDENFPGIDDMPVPCDLIAKQVPSGSFLASVAGGDELSVYLANGATSPQSYEGGSKTLSDKGYAWTFNWYGFDGIAVDANLASTTTRLPFDAILNPEPYLTTWSDDGITPSLLLSMVIPKKPPKLNFSLMSNNFHSEVVKFFLQDEVLTSFESSAKASFELDPAKVYAMDIVLRNSDIKSVYDYSKLVRNSDGVAAPMQTLSKSLESQGGLPKATPICEMYNRGSAFGSKFISKLGGPTIDVYYGTYATHTPPYFDGFARTRVLFKPNASISSYTVEEILNSASFDYFRANEASQRILLEDPTYDFNTTGSGDQTFMQMSSSMTIKGIIEEKAKTWDSDANVDQIAESTNTIKKKWVIHPKFECPVMDFKDVAVSVPLATSPTASSRGMWHQYGVIPDYNNSGIFLEVMDVPFKERINPALTASLAEVMGVEQTKKAIGKISPEGKVLKEALVVVPYLVNEETSDVVNFFNLSDEAVKALRSKANNNTVQDDADQLVRQIRLMKEYVFPPVLDFVTFSPKKNTDIKTPIMYIFEFTRELSQQDLGDIWQGVLPQAGLEARKQESIINLTTEINEDISLDKIVENNINTLLINNDRIIKEKVVNVDPGFQGGAKTFGQQTKLFKNGQKLLDDIQISELRFFVFKVKQRGEFEYKNITQDTTDDGFNFDFKAKGLTQIPSIKKDGKFKLSYSYNWPYDFFSLIELAKVDAQITLGDDVELVAKEVVKPV